MVGNIRGLNRKLFQNKPNTYNYKLLISFSTLLFTFFISVLNLTFLNLFNADFG